MTVDKMTEEELAGFFANAFREVVLPVLDKMDQKMATKADILDLELKLRDDLATKKQLRDIQTSAASL